MQIGNYTVIDTIVQNDVTTMYKASSQDGTLVAIKSATDPYDISIKNQLYKEYAITKDLGNDFFGSYLQILELDNTYLVMSLENAATLGQSMSFLKNSEKDFLRCAHHIAEAIEILHSHRILHLDLSPSNILCSTDMHSIKIVDFGKSAYIASGKRHQLPSEVTPYSSPEQTGLIAKAVDPRSDLYSVGAIFYEIFAGNPPFTERDLLKLAHEHLAKIPEKLSSINPKVHPVIEKIIQKLLAKDQDDRYESASALKADIERLIREPSESFEPGVSRDASTLSIPQKLYGRDSELASLQKTITESISTKPGLLFVRGYSGIGKTSFINELIPMIQIKEGLFLKGKFDQYNRSTPYVAFLTIFSDILRFIHEQPLNTKQEILEKLRATLGDGMSVLSKISPDFEAVFGEMSPVNIDQSLLKNQLYIAVERLFEIITVYKKRLLLFLDDMQWADLASLEVLQMIATSPTLHGITIIGAYRSNEVSASHPLIQMLEKISNDRIDIQTIDLKPLNLQECTQMLSDTLRQNGVGELAQIILQKTEGNPFFIRQFLQTLYREKLLRYSEDATRWVWNIKDIEHENIANNVLDHLLQKIAYLSFEAKEFLKSASVIGDYFELEAISQLNKMEDTEVMKVAHELSSEGIVDFDFSALNLTHSSQQDLIHMMEGHFVHDKIRQASYMMMDEEEKIEKHFSIAREFLSTEPDKVPKNKILYAAGHIVESIETIKATPLHTMAAHILFQAVQQAKQALAYTEALKYIDAALSLSDEEKWDNEYRSTFELYLSKAEILRLASRYEEAGKIFELLLNRTEIERFDRARIFNEELSFHFSQGEIANALLSGTKALDQLALALPYDESGLTKAKQTEIEWLHSHLNDLDTVKELPEMTDGMISLAMTVLMNMGIPAFVSRQDMFGVIALRMARLTFQYGVSSVSSYGFALSGMIFGAGLSRYADGYRFGQTALELQRRFNNKSIECKLLRVYGAYVSSWTETHQQTLETLEHAYVSGIENGDFAYASYCLNHIFTRQFLLDMPLDSLLYKTDSFMNFIESLHDENILTIQKILCGTVACLLGQTPALDSLSYNHYDEEEFFSQLTQAGYKTGLGYYHIYKLQVCYLHQLYDVALEHARKAEPFLLNLKGNILESEWVFYYSLTLYKLDLQSVESLRLSAFLEKFAQWAKLNPSSFGPKYTILKAKEFFEQEHFDDAFSLMEDAVESQEKSPLVKAVFLELISECWTLKHNRRVAAVYLQEAYEIYHDLKAYEKAKLLVHSQLLSSIRANSYKSTHSSNSLNRLNSFDEATISKATFALSQKIDRSTLIENFLQIIAQNFGAQIGGLILKSDQEYFLEGVFNIDTNPQIDVRHIPLERLDELPKTLILSALETKTSIIIGDLKNHETFAKDPVVYERGITSAICAPMFLKGSLFGLIYLENNLVKNFFDSSRQNILNIILTQTALTLELEELYNRDKLTGCYSRQKLDDILFTNAFHSLAILNIDDFDSINSTFGYVVGDEILKLFALFITEFLPESASLFRFGGDEFVIICYSECRLEAIAEQITEHLKIKKFSILDFSMHISCTIGIADNLISGLDTPLVQAHAAMKEMKYSGPGKFYKFSSDSTYLTHQKHARDWTTKVREAIERDDIIPYFQPIINNTTGEVERYECLARLREGDHIITPYHFIGPAKIAGLLPKITERMLVKSFEAFRNSGYGFSVNITEEDLHSGTLPELLQQLAQTNGLDPASVSLEILENVSAEQSDYVLDQLLQIKKLGFKIALDDFGSENSNLFKLQKLNVDYIKIDGSFIKDINTNQNSFNICKTIVYLADVLQCSVIAEFVHSKEVFESVKSLGIAYSQGFYFSEPKPTLQ